jgi:hypothetical protein
MAQIRDQGASDLNGLYYTVGPDWTQIGPLEAATERLTVTMIIADALN